MPAAASFTACIRLQTKGTMKSFLDTLADKVIVFDGAMGTNIQTQNLTADDFGGEQKP